MNDPTTLPSSEALTTEALEEAALIAAANGIDQLQDEWGTWAAQTFPDQTKASILAHLRKEIGELKRATTPAEHCEEMADCQGLLFSLAHMLAIDLRGETTRKLEINRARTWGAPNEQGFSEHVRESDAANPPAQF